jgi:hypothetical protein
MTAATVRLASADVEAGLTGAALGTTEVTGHAEADTTARSGPPRPRTAEAASPALSPARQALADHLGNLEKLAAEVARKAKPVDRLREQLAAAQVDLANSELVLNNIDAAHSAAIAEAARVGGCSAEPVESADAEAAVARSRRHVNSIRQALEEVNADQIKANQNLESAKASFDQIALDILVEEFNIRLPQWALQRDKFHLAEIDMLGLLQALGQQGRDLEAATAGSGLVWLRKLETLQPPWHHLEAGHVERGGPREVSAASSRWSAVLHRLKTDPGATF